MITNLILALGNSSATEGVPAFTSVCLCFLAIFFVFLLAGMTAATTGPEKKIRAQRQLNAEGSPTLFTLNYLTETVILDPGKTWIKVDTFKWVTRGLIEAPQSFHVAANGAVEINGEKIELTDPDSEAKLEHEINKRHVLVAAPKPATPAAKTRLAAETHSGKVHFKVRLDQVGQLMVECHRGGERSETGLRGLNTFIQNGLMLKPQSLHVDPLQRYLEIDEIRFERSESGAQQLQDYLNAHYAPTLKSQGEGAIDIRDNPASPTGFDISFVTHYAGMRSEVKGHLSQERLDILQDDTKCGLLYPGIVLRISPPNLLIRRKKPDGGEERIPEFDDIPYRKITALQLQQIFNHPHIRRGADNSSATVVEAASTKSDHRLVMLRVVRNPQNPLHLWLEGVEAGGVTANGKAFTHHNLAEMQHQGIFQPHLDVALSLDHRTLSILNKETHQETTLGVDHHSNDEALAKASQLLTDALKPLPAASVAPPVTCPTTDLDTPIEATAVPVTPTPTGAEFAPVVSSMPPEVPASSQGAWEKVEQASSPRLDGDSKGTDQVSAPPLPTYAETKEALHATETPSPGPVPAKVPPDLAPPLVDQHAATPVAALVTRPPQVKLEDFAEPSPTSSPPVVSPVLALFDTWDPLDTLLSVFQQLRLGLGLPELDVRLSLPRVFENRRFEVLSYSHTTVESVLDLRGGDFHGFYLTHIREQNILLVYACQGRHIEWGVQHCLLETSVGAEPLEFKGAALRGLAQDQESRLCFIVEPAHKQWLKSHERSFLEIDVRFITVEELAANWHEYQLVWPEPSAEMATGLVLLAPHESADL